MKYGRQFFAASLIALGALCPAAVARAANINVVWTSEVGQFAPLWITKEARLFESTAIKFSSSSSKAPHPPLPRCLLATLKSACFRRRW
jgi:hypothetical protein